MSLSRRNSKKLLNKKKSLRQRAQRKAKSKQTPKDSSNIDIFQGQAIDCDDLDIESSIKVDDNPFQKHKGSYSKHEQANAIDISHRAKTIKTHQCKRPRIRRNKNEPTQLCKKSYSKILQQRGRLKDRYQPFSPNSSFIKNTTIDIPEKDTEFLSHLDQVFADCNTLHFESHDISLAHDKDCKNHEKSSKYFVKLGPYSLKYNLPAKAFLKIRKSKKSRSGKSLASSQYKSPDNVNRFNREEMLLQKVKLSKYRTTASHQSSHKKLPSRKYRHRRDKEFSVQEKFECLTNQLASLYTKKGKLRFEMPEK